MHYLQNYTYLFSVAAVLISLVSITQALSLEALSKKATSNHLTRPRRDGGSKPSPEEWFEMLTPVGSDGSSSSEMEEDNEVLASNKTSLLKMHHMTHDSTHCQNGGVGFFGSFCLCPDDFTGQYCEREIKGSCNQIPYHGDWIYLDCSICHCMAGLLECEPHILEGCEEWEAANKARNGQIRHSADPSVFFAAFCITLFWFWNPSGDTAYKED